MEPVAETEAAGLATKRVTGALLCGQGSRCLGTSWEPLAHLMCIVAVGQVLQLTTSSLLAEGGRHAECCSNLSTL